MTAALQIRPMQAADEGAVGEIAYLTGYFGNSAARYFPARRLFKLLWVAPYFHGAGQGCFVAVRGSEVLGYVLGAPNQRTYLKAFVRVLARRVWTVLLPLRDLLPSLGYLLRVARFPAPHADWREFPAHLHINLRPEARGLHLGEKLLQAHLNALIEGGVKGVQLSTTAENVAALGLYRKLGFSVALSRPTRLWVPWLGRATEQIIVTRRL